MTPVVIGRFQTDWLTSGHTDLIMEAYNRLGKVLIIVGESNGPFTDKNPLPAVVVADMVRQCVAAEAVLDVLIVQDHPDDRVWSERIDNVLSGFHFPILYGSRDSFIKSYTGIYPCEEIAPVDGRVSATKERERYKGLHNYINTAEFRAGIIYATQNRFPTTYPTVDIAVLDEYGSPSCKILLGRKPGWKSWVLPGGFVDPTDPSLEYAAWRELSEEVVGLDVHGLKYLASLKIDDARYRGTKDGIISSLFVAWKLEGFEQAGDDLEEVKWFTFKDALSVVAANHKPLVERVFNHLQI